jgi:hypothetical protein
MSFDNGSACIEPPQTSNKFSKHMSAIDLARRIRTLWFVEGVHRINVRSPLMAFLSLFVEATFIHCPAVAKATVNSTWPKSAETL